MRSLALALLTLLLSAPAAAAPITITVELLPGSGPTYEWGLSLRTEFERVGQLGLVTDGFTNFAFNPGQAPPISPLDSGFVDSIFPPSKLLFIASAAIGLSLNQPGVTVLLGTFTSPFNSASQVSVGYADLELGYTATDADTLVPFDSGLIEIRVVPEASQLLLAGLAISLLFVRARRRAVIGAACLCLLAGTASAAPIDITARLDPGQSGPTYAWSLYLRVDPGYEVGGIAFLTTGFDSAVFNAANPGIGILDSAYTTDPLGDGRNAFLVNNYANGVALSEPGVETLLATFYGPHRTSPPVILWDGSGDDAFGYIAVDTYLRLQPPGDVSLSAYPRALIALVVVPEASHSLLAALGMLGAIALLERRSVRAAPRETGPLR